MRGHVSQKWYEFKTGDPEIDRYGGVYRLVIKNADRFDWNYRLVIENVVRYGWEYRLLIDNNGNHCPKKKRLNIKTDDCYCLVSNHEGLGTSL